VNCPNCKTEMIVSECENVSQTEGVAEWHFSFEAHGCRQVKSDGDNVFFEQLKENHRRNYEAVKEAVKTVK
jgi:hypothetical protein